jgi:hypothetical protein
VRKKNPSTTDSEEKSILPQIQQIQQIKNTD